MAYSVYSYSGFPFERGLVRFNRVSQEVKGLSSKENDDNTGTVIINALGVNPDDIELNYQYGDVRDSVLFTVKGESKIDGVEKPYSLEYNFPVFRPVNKVSKKFVNGLVILTLYFNKPSQPEIEVV